MVIVIRETRSYHCDFFLLTRGDVHDPLPIKQLRILAGVPFTILGKKKAGFS